VKRGAGSGRFLGDLWRDLRETRMLPVIILLIAALFAVPFLMGGGDEATTPAATDAETASVAPPFETEPVVLASQPELRTFKKRLSSFQARNPFNQYLPKVKEPTDTSTSATDALPTDGSTIPTDGSAPVDPGTTPTDPGTTPTDPGTTPTDPGTSDTGGSGNGGDDGVELLSTRIDVRVGPVGDTEVVKDVKFLDFLPDKQRPVLEYLQSDFDLTNAVFIVSPFVNANEGDGKCAPTPQNCQFLQLEVGDTHAFQYDDGERYTITLLDVNLHSEPFVPASGEDPARTPEFGSEAQFGKVVGG